MSPVLGPDPNSPCPVPEHPRIGYLKPIIRQDNIVIGDYTYYDDPDGPEHFVERCVQYHYDFMGDKLVIGKFCAIATGAAFIMNGANHDMTGFSTYPFHIFKEGWEQGFQPDSIPKLIRGDTIIGNDVWIGSQATILPGVTVGDGAIIGTKATVGSHVPPYAIVVGNPGRILRFRFPPEIIALLLSLQWWNWDIEKITRHINAIRGNDLQLLRRLA